MEDATNVKVLAEDPAVVPRVELIAPRSVVDEPVAEMSSAVPDPLGLALRFRTSVSAVDVARSLVERYGPDCVRCLQTLGNSFFEISCSSQTAQDVLIQGSPLDICDTVCDVGFLGEIPRHITIKNLPFNVSDEQFKNFLAPYGRIVSWTYEMFTDFPDISNGNRKVNLIMSRPVPNFLTYDRRRIIVG